MANYPFAQAYKISVDAVKLKPERIDLDLRSVDNISMEKRIFIRPRAEEIGGIFNSVEGEQPGYQHVVHYYY